MEIHRALNERAVSEETYGGVVAGGPGRWGNGRAPVREDDPLLQAPRAEGHVAGVGRMVRALLRQRNIGVPGDFRAGLAPRTLDALRAASGQKILAAASAADSFADFLARLDDPGS